MAIDIGADPIDRLSGLSGGATYIDKNNPANASGTLHSVKIWAEGDDDMSSLIVGTFYTTNGDTLKCRDSEAIGDVEAGAERTFTGLSIIVEEGDYIGLYCVRGTIEADISGFAGLWIVAGEYIDPNDETDYFFLAGYAMSLYGYGEGAPPGRENKEYAHPDLVSGGETTLHHHSLSKHIDSGKHHQEVSKAWEAESFNSTFPTIPVVIPIGLDPANPGKKVGVKDVTTTGFSVYYEIAGQDVGWKAREQGYE